MSEKNSGKKSNEEADETRQKLIREGKADVKKKRIKGIVFAVLAVLAIALCFLTPKVIIPAVGREVSYYKLVHHPEQIQVGDTIYFGGFEVNNTWQVLAVEDSKILIINELCLIQVKYNDIYLESTNRTYALCEWLDEVYYDINFSDKEKALIFDNGAGKVFSLSSYEAKTYFKHNSDRRTGYYKDDRAASWWLRDTIGEEVYIVNFDGCIDTTGTYLKYGPGVRPAIWLDLG